MKRHVDFYFELWELLNTSFRATVKVRQKELDQYDITLQQSAVLRVALRLGKKATPTEISRQLFLELNSISEQLRRMEKDGLVRKVKDLDRKNLIRIEVTQKGYDSYCKSRTQKYIDYVMSSLTEKERLELWSILAKLRARAVEELGIRDLNLYPPADYLHSGVSIDQACKE